MRDAYFALGAVMLATIAMTWLLGRLVERVEPLLRAVQVIVVRTCIGLIFTLVTAQAVGAGGLWLLLLPVSVLLSLFSFVLAGGIIFLWVRNGLDDDTETFG